MNQYIINEPYPSLEDVVPNCHDLQMILADYSGLVSELTAVTQYFYNHLFANYSGKNSIGKIIMEIAIAEMMHLDKLGELVIKLGGDPQFVYPKGNCMQFWTGGLVTYDKEIENMITTAILLEKETIDIYTQHAQTACNQTVSLLLLRIVEDERLHLKTFCSLLDGAC